MNDEGESSTTATSGFDGGRSFQRTGTVKLRLANSIKSTDDPLESLLYQQRDYTVVEVPINHPFWGTSDQYATILGCLPLACGPLAMCIGFASWGLCKILIPLLADEFTWDETGDIIVGLFLTCLATVGVFGITMRWKAGIHMLNIGFNVFMVSQAVSLTTKWLEWSLALGGVTTEEHAKWLPGSSDVVYMVSFTLGVIAFLGFSMAFAIGWLKSLKMVLTAGGHGWERLNYIEILEGASPAAASFHEKVPAPTREETSQEDLDLTFS